MLAINIKIYMKNLVLILFSLLLLSCATRKDVVYYQDIDDKYLVPLEVINEHPTIQVNDILKITTNALNPESVIPFTLDAGGVAAGGGGRGGAGGQVGMLKLTGYLVNDKGEINFPQLGKVKVGGKTTQDIQDDLEKKLSVFIKNPTVNVRLLNYKFTVQGEVKNPGTFEIIEENMTLPQALGLAGDLTIRARRDNVLIYRQEGENREVKRIDLTQTDWMNTDFFYVKPNDVIYIEPNNPQIKSAGFISNIGTLLSVFSILLSTTLLIVR